MRLPWKKRPTEDQAQRPETPAPSEASAKNPELVGEKIAPFTMERLVKVIEDNDYSCALDDDKNTVAASWNDLPFRFHLSESSNWLGISTLWEPPEALTVLEESRVVAALQDAANEWNRHYLQPTGYPMEMDDAWVIVFHQSVFVDEGVNDEQIAMALRISISVNLEARDTIESLLPPVC